jgi:hypothetical protein
MPSGYDNPKPRAPQQLPCSYFQHYPRRKSASTTESHSQNIKHQFFVLTNQPKEVYADIKPHRARQWTKVRNHHETSDDKDDTNVIFRISLNNCTKLANRIIAFCEKF